MGTSCTLERLLTICETKLRNEGLDFHLPRNLYFIWPYGCESSWEYNIKYVVEKFPGFFNESI
jgi:hypothetical protein